MCERYFVKLPNDLIWDLEEESIMLYNDEMLIVPILYQLVNNMNQKGQTFFSLEDLVTSCGYIPKASKGKTNDKFRNALIILEDIGYITNSSMPISDIKGNTFVKCKLNLNLNNNFFMIYDDDFESIVSADVKSEKKTYMMIIYSYISARLNRTNEGKEYTFFKVEDAVKHLSISSKTFLEGVRALKELGILYSDNNGAVSQNKISVNIYSFTEEGLEYGLSNSKRFYNNLKR